eukprot:215265-Karenia_brevis.AAC.1
MLNQLEKERMLTQLMTGKQARLEKEESMQRRSSSSEKEQQFFGTLKIKQRLKVGAEQLCPENLPLSGV